MVVGFYLNTGRSRTKFVHEFYMYIDSQLMYLKGQYINDQSILLTGHGMGVLVSV